MPMLRGVATLATVLLPVLAGAQTSVSLTNPSPPGWDASGHVAWLTVDKSRIAPEWNSWYDVATFGGSLGRFVGRHVKLEFDAAASSSARLYITQQIAVPGQPYPVFTSQAQRFSMATLSGGASYQFLDNQWFHPVIGAGVEAARESRHVDPANHPLQVPAGLSLQPPGTTRTWTTQPFASAGFKWYVAERAFIRSDVRASFDRGGVGHVSWRTGVGADF
jgi:hypothetical protein